MHAGLTPDPSFRSVIPAIHQTSTYAQPRPGEFVEDYDYARSANPTRAALERALGELEGGRAVAFSSGLAAEHALITVVCEAGSHVVLPADLYGGTYRLVDKVLTRWGLHYDLVDQTDLEALERAVARDAADLGRVPDQPAAERGRHRRASSAARGTPWSLSTTRSPPPPTSARSSSAPTSSCTRPPSTSAATPTWWGARWSAAAAALRTAAFRPERRRRRPGPVRLLLVHRGLRTLHLRMEAHARSAAAVVELLRSGRTCSDARWPGFSGMVSFRHPRRPRWRPRTRLFTLAESLAASSR